MVAKRSASQPQKLQMPEAIDLFATVKQNDIRQAVPVTESMRIRSVARMEQILATDPNPPRPVIAGSTRNLLQPVIAGSTRNFLQPVIAGSTRNLNARRWALRLTAIPVAAALIIAAVSLIPGPDLIPQAFATWTAVPSPASEEFIARANAECRLRMNRTTSGWGIPPTRAQLQQPPEFAEQRGNWVTLVYDTQEANPTVCLTELSEGRFRNRGMWTLEPGNFNNLGDARWVESGAFAVDGESAVQYARDRIGGGVTATVYAESEVPNEGSFALLILKVEPELSGVEVRLTNGEAVTATLFNSVALAWWPLPGERAEATDLLPSDLDWLDSNDSGILRIIWPEYEEDLPTGGFAALMSVGGPFEEFVIEWNTTSRLEVEVESVLLQGRDGQTIEVPAEDLPRDSVAARIRQTRLETILLG
jgi:hypothetical protein